MLGPDGSATSDRQRPQGRPTSVSTVPPVLQERPRTSGTPRSSACRASAVPALVRRAEIDQQLGVVEVPGSARR